MKYDVRSVYADRGMTLIELLVIVSIYTILMLAITTSITNLYKANSYSMAQANEVDNARRGMIEWGMDTKEVTGADDGSFPIAVIEPHHFGFYADVDPDSDVEYVEYILSTTTLIKNVYDPSGSPATYDLTTPDMVKTLSEFVQNITEGTSTFSYFDDNGNQLISTSPVIDVRYIRAQIIVNINPAQAPGEFMLRSSVAPRNLKDNL